MTNKFKAIIFDFNGTLFWDSEFHEEAWNFMAEELRGYKYSKEEINKYMHGKTNREIISYLIQNPLPNEDYEKIATKKENLYKEICKQNKDDFILAKGVVELLDELKKNNIPITIATSSDKRNVDFFIENFDLGKWFDTSKIVFNDYSFPSKPAPDIFLKAAANLNLKPEECIVFEDSIVGIESAINAGIRRIIAVNSNENFYQIEKSHHIYKIIESFESVIIDTLFHS
jgi:HAD superfamily hydrolase (TIGR01509 family)